MKNIDLPKWFTTERENLITRYFLLYFCPWIYVFAPQNYVAMQTLPRNIMEQYRLCPAKLWSTEDFAPQNHGAFVFHNAKLGSLHYLLCKIMEQCRLCPHNHGDIISGAKITTEVIMMMEICFDILVCSNGVKHSIVYSVIFNVGRSSNTDRVNVSAKALIIFFFLSPNYFKDLYNHWDRYLRKTYVMSWYP